jgi:hypothetical protein
MMEDRLTQMDKNVLSVGSLPAQDLRADARNWLSKSPAQRLMALELLRMSVGGYDPLTTRLQRVYTVATLV